MPLNNKIEKHPENFMELSPYKFAKKFGNTNYFYQKECFKELIKEYKRQSLKDKKDKRMNLASGLENLSTSFYIALKSMEKVCDICKNYLNNPFKK